MKDLISSLPIMSMTVFLPIQIVSEQGSSSPAFAN